MLSILEDELKPHATPWALAPPVSLDGEAVEPAKQPAVSGSQTWAYQVLELHRTSEDPEGGSLIVVPGLGWHRESFWAEAEHVIDRAMERVR